MQVGTFTGEPSLKSDEKYHKGGPGHESQRTLNLINCLLEAREELVGLEPIDQLQWTDAWQSKGGNLQH